LKKSSNITSYKTLQWIVENKTGHLIPDQPPANAMTAAFFAELNDLRINKISGSVVKAIIIYGRRRHFSSGAALDELYDMVKKETIVNSKGTIIHYPDSMKNNLDVLQFFNKLNIPVIAAISGVCLGSGLELASHCHFRISAPNAVLGLPESSYNLIPGLGGVQQLLANGTSKMNAMDIIFKGNSFSAIEGLNIGIIDRIVPKNKLIEAAILLAKISATEYRKYLKHDYLRKFDEQFKEN